MLVTGVAARQHPASVTPPFVLIVMHQKPKQVDERSLSALILVILVAFSFLENLFLKGRPFPNCVCVVSGSVAAARFWMNTLYL